MFRTIKRNKTLVATVAGMAIGAGLVYNFYNSKTFLEIPDGGLERLRKYRGALIYALPGGDVMVTAVTDAEDAISS
jgi:hypothetical protein